MRLLKYASLFSTYLLLGWLSIGCGHAQVAPTTYQVKLSWSAPGASGSWAGCTTSNPCSFVASRVTVASTASACPVANTSTQNYTPLNTSAPASGTAFDDAGASGLTVCYIVQTEQGSAVSIPSNVVGPFSVPASPLAPSVTGSQALAEEKPLPSPVGSSPAPALTAELSMVK